MRRDLAAAAACVVAAFGVADSAHGAPARILFRVEAKPYAEALLDLAQQANVTLIGAGACHGTSRAPVVGVMTLEQALGQLMSGAPCGWRVIAPGAVEVTPLAQVEAIRAAPPVTVSELLVTATRRVRNARELAVAVTALPHSQLVATGAVDAGEAAGQLVGVLATNLGPGRNKLLLRGLSDGVYTGRARSIVATYLDDLPLNYNAPDPDLRLVDVDRVEVARGPQGALYGSGSLSGVYRIVARKPDLARYGAEVRASGALTAHGAPSGAVEGFVNAPILRGEAGARLSAYEEIQGGYLDDISQMRSNVDRTERRGARLVLLYEPSDVWNVNITVAGQHLRSDDTHYTTPGLGLKRSVRIPEPHVNDIELATMTVRRSWGWGQLTSSSGFVRHAYGSLFDATATQDLYTQFAQTSAYSERTRTRMFVQDAVVTSRGAGPLQWLAGAYGSYTSEHSPTEFLAQVPRAPNVEVYGDDRTDHVRELAAYAEVSYDLAPRWTLAVGGRAFSIHSRTLSDVVSENYPPRSIDRAMDFASFSPKVSLQHELPNGNLAYAVISEGYRAGGVNSGGANPLPASRETYAPDRLLNYELGLKFQTPNKWLSVDSALFYDLWSDIQTDQFRPSGIPYTTNAGDAHVLGFETELAINAGNGLTAQLNGRVARTRTVRPNPDFAAQLVNGLPGAPALSGGVVLTYQRRILGDWTMRFVGQANYVGTSRVTFDATQPKMGGYTRAKLSAELSHRNLGLQVYVSNPLNSFSDTFAFGNPFNPSQIRQITPQRPITVGMTLSAGL